MNHWKSACATVLVIVSAAFGFAAAFFAASPDAELTIAENGSTRATIVVRAGAGTWEQKAAADLQKYLGLMTGVEPRISATVPGGSDPVLLVGEAALSAEPGLRDALQRRQKRDPLVRSDALIVRRAANRIYLAGSNDESHYFAVAWLLNQWGCRWYLPTEIGEAIPERQRLTVGSLDFTYAPPFEIRHYWLSWNADRTGSDEFRRRNFMTETSVAGMGHALGEYTRDLVPPGKTIFDIALSAPRTAEHVASKIEGAYGAGKDISLAIEDGLYRSLDDMKLAIEYDKYMLQPSLTGSMMTLYSNVGKILRTKYPSSPAKLGGLAYSNVTLPPKLIDFVEPNIVMWLAPIDIDPNHGMDDTRSSPRQEYKEIMYRWAELMQGRLLIYDYDQGMLIWRDLPNPSHHAFAQDVKHYARAGILGVGTESRGATATTFLNLFFRGQLMWNPDADVDALLGEFYPKFYGPGAEPAAEYWNTIFEAWRNTVVTEHEYPAAPAIYTPELLNQLERSLKRMEGALAPVSAKMSLSRNEKLYLERLRFTQLGFAVLRDYIGMVTSAARDNDYPSAVRSGERALAAREALTHMNPTFTTYRIIGERGPAWFPGEVDQMRELASLTDSTRGTLVAQLPLVWDFSRGDPLPAGWTYKGPVGGFPELPIQAASRQTPGWSQVRTDLYLQAQGVLASDGQSALGEYWYRTSVELTSEQISGNVRLMFPGLFNEAWLYVNGQRTAWRNFREPWWGNNYKFEWDVGLTSRLQPGRNEIVVRGFNPHHYGGMFRRPFLYRTP